MTLSVVPRKPPRPWEFHAEDPPAQIFRGLLDFVRDVVAWSSSLPARSFLVVPFVGGDTDFRVQTSRVAPPTAVYLAKVVDTDADATITNALSIHWRWDKGAIVLRAVPGLTSSTNYELTLEVVG